MCHIQEGIFVGVKVSHKEANYEKFIAALEITSEVQDSANLKKAKERGELVQRYAQKGAEVISTAGMICKCTDCWIQIMPRERPVVEMRLLI